MEDSSIVWFALRLKGARLNPQKVTSLLGLNPSSSYEKGFTKVLSSGAATAARPIGAWSYKRELKPGTSSFEEELNKFLKEIPELSLASIPGVDSAVLDIFFGLSDDNSEMKNYYQCELSVYAINRLVSLGVVVSITIS